MQSNRPVRGEAGTRRISVYGLGGGTSGAMIDGWVSERPGGLFVSLAHHQSRGRAIVFSVLCLLSDGD